MKRNYNNLTAALEYYLKKYNVENRDQLLKLFDEKQAASGEFSHSTKPKYIYLNRLVRSKKEILVKLQEDNFELVKYEKRDEKFLDNKEFKKFIDSLENTNFIKDIHVKNLLIFKHNSILNKNYNLFKEGHLLQIDKVKEIFYF